ncbi:MAG: putative spermidine/putrescine transport system permease protein [Rhodospirillaceae bacterium]|jgi:putative spermidine/putrescine transport system permease protein|nr:putative spermidine/putrescine transport system permease protein [Rhodospirillaceae bacterium]
MAQIAFDRTSKRKAAARVFSRGRRRFGLALPALIFLFAFFILPLSLLLLRSIAEPEPGLHNYAKLLGDATYGRVLLNTFTVAGVVTLVTLFLGYPVAWLLVILPSRVSRWLFAIVLLSMWTNLLARTYGWMVLLQRTGVINRTLMNLGVIDAPLPLINNLLGVTIGMTYIMLPFVILPLHATLSAIDPAIMQAASIVGARPSQIFFRVLLPLSAPGIAAGGLMVFVMALGYYVTPALLGGTANMMLAELIAQLVQSFLNWGLGSAAAFILLSLTLVLYGVYVRAFGLGKPQ